MASIPGRPGGCGKKGRSGRKGAYQELMDATREFNLMYRPHEVEKLLKKYRQFQADIEARRPSKIKLSVREIMLAKEILGNERLISQHYGKVVPEHIDLTSLGEKINPAPLLNGNSNYGNKKVAAIRKKD